MSIDRLSSDLGAFAENQQCCFIFVYKNSSSVSSEMSIDRLSSAFVAFAEEFLLKIEYLELINQTARNVSRSLEQRSLSFRGKVLIEN
ncbi:hypothetical protein TSAR_015080 [Trichomalopsis sarcophagae]|uniref:Uncharacterized protein n=1 Tax=Trichomalopsis sarcophagae TaxID=543379 RepID=A0A232EGZ7_9HYME|nr:hypothetical protein TSAR_015080 [Trichomalopsis sarcophagae]